MRFFKQLQTQKIFSTIPYEKPNSREFFEAVKNNNLGLVEYYIVLNRYIIFDFDSVNIHKLKNTALHWAVRRKFYDISKVLIDNKCNLNARDITNRTPLYIAAVQNDFKHVQVLAYIVTFVFRC